MKAVALILVLCLTLSFCGCIDPEKLQSYVQTQMEENSGEIVYGENGRLPEVPYVDFADAIENFSPDGFNDKTLRVGQTHTPTAAVWLSAMGSGVYISQSGIVTVSKEGTVRGEASGTVYLLYKGVSDMHEVYRITVTEPPSEPLPTFAAAPQVTEPALNSSGLPAIPQVDFAREIANFEPDHFNDQCLSVGGAFQPTAAIWMRSSMCKAYVSDPAVIRVDENGTVYGLSQGEAYVIYVVSASMHSLYRVTVE